ncbi:PREDICTED: tetratricopeptide repeat protein 25-like isoform X2 [Priapulus caudatus]|uniref:Outer dynein arm-docking complex subunit 4 n=1 Tax=Priapulus caudatus TaxID=37621 RepID=A0ABM1DZH6_PRICU|nr:PREDICTED: tetratricopeptide repeat protein 25-like isoform X2 [Priapulus caudatus]
MMYDDDIEGENGPKSSFSIYLAEGDALFKQGEYKKALESYSTALEIQPTDKNALVARSKCYLQLGDAQAGLRDAEAALATDKDFNKGLYQKAEALYAMGNFEFALVFYHRGHKLRPELQEFRLGIQKAQEAIDNAIGSPSSVKLRSRGDSSFLATQQAARKSNIVSTAARMQATAGISMKTSRDPPGGVKSDKTIKQLLGELYADKEYLEKLLRNDELTKTKTETSVKICELINEGLHYLDTRTEFWRQQRPIYARKRDSANARRGRLRVKPVAAYSRAVRAIMKVLEEIDYEQAKGKYQTSLKKAQNLIKPIQNLSEKECSNKAELQCTLYSYIGNAYLELGNRDKALQFHKKDLEISQANGLAESKSRAMDNLGRVYARFGMFKNAIKIWEEKLPFAQTEMEKTWLYHESGRCLLELTQYELALEYGQLSLDHAMKADDEVWVMNASVLIGQSQVKLGDYRAAEEYFQRALDITELLGDREAQAAIVSALTDVQCRREGHVATTEYNKESVGSAATDSVAEDFMTLSVSNGTSSHPAEVSAKYAQHAIAPIKCHNCDEFWD